MNLDLTNAVKLLSEKLTSWYELAIKSIPNIAVAIIVLILFFILASLVRKLSERVFFRITKSRVLTNLINTVFHLMVVLIGLFISLEIMNLEKTVTSILAGAGVIGLALGFAFQEIASNFVSGVFIAIRKPFKLGDIVEIENYFGEVTDINLRTTSITTFKGLEAIIPNKKMFTEPLINYTTTPKRRIFLEVGVSYGDDLEKVKSVTKSAIEKVSNRIQNEDIEVFFTGFGSSSINLVARYWIDYPNNVAWFKGVDEGIRNIKSAYDENDIMIPFPIRTLDFGIKGGEKLSQMLEKGE